MLPTQSHAAKVMFGAAKAAGVRRIVHISITNPDPNITCRTSAARDSWKMHYATSASPTPSYGPPCCTAPRTSCSTTSPGRYAAFPWYSCRATATTASSPSSSKTWPSWRWRPPPDESIEMDAVGPEVFTYAQIVRLVRDKIGARCWVVPSPNAVTYLAGRALGWLLNDIVLTRDEIKGLSRGLLVSRSNQAAPAPTKLTEWLDQNAQHLGNSYANEMARHYG